MARKFALFLIVVLTFSTSTFARNTLTKQELLKKILVKAKENAVIMDQFGYYQATNTKKMDEGKIKDQETRLHRMTWIQNHPYLELLKVDGREPNAEEKKKEADRKKKFLKSVNKKKGDYDDDDEDGEEITLDDLYEKYDFDPLPPEPNSAYGFSFKPKAGKLKDRSKIERVINHVTGKFWTDSEYNIIRAEAKLMDNVRFGLGILGKLEALRVSYEQQLYDQVTLPSVLFIHFRARILLKSEEREIQAHYTDYFRRPANTGGQN
jgi:hypothetical protein